MRLNRVYDGNRLSVIFKRVKEIIIIIIIIIMKVFQTSVN